MHSSCPVSNIQVCHVHLNSFSLRMSFYPLELCFPNVNKTLLTKSLSVTSSRFPFSSYKPRHKAGEIRGSIQLCLISLCSSTENIRRQRAN